MINTARAETPATFLFDAGNWAEVKDFEPAEKSAFMWDMMAEIGTDAVTPGDKELLDGMSAVKGLFARHPEVRVVSANITDKSGALVWPESAIIDRGGVKVAVTGVTGGAAYSFNVTRGIQKSDDFAFQDTREALRRVVPALKKQADIVVVLLQEGPADARRIVDEIPGMDVVIVGNNPGYMFNPDRIGNTLLVRGGNRGQYLSVLDLILDDKNAIIDYSGEGKPLGQAVAKEPKIDAKATKWEDDFKAREAAAKRKEALDKAMLHGTERFVGAEMCGRCHTDEYAGWSRSPHAQARYSLPEDQAQLAEGLTFDNVQCETCHGMGTLHGTTGMVTKVEESTCTGCHSSHGVTGVDYASALATIH